MRIAVSGSKGLLGWHAAARLHATNCADRFAGRPETHDIVEIDRSTFADISRLREALTGVEAVLHFAGVNRGDDDVVEAANPAIARQLVEACRAAAVTPRIVYANSTHSSRDTPYGRSKREAGRILADFCGEGLTDLILPHIFGECAKPRYNNVTATLIDNIWAGDAPVVDPNGRVQLLHAGAAAEWAIEAAIDGRSGIHVLPGRDISVSDLYEKLQGFHELYSANIFPQFEDEFDLALFNAYRTAAFPERYPFVLDTKEDHRGILFESAKGGSSGQSFISTTLPGKRRGDHFHLGLVERFLVVKGDAIIRIRKVLTSEVFEFAVSGERPVAVDMPPLHTHHIENVGTEEVVTFFWSHKLFDPAFPDTYADMVN